MFETGFDRFWAAWPKNPRKGAKQECSKKWKKYYCETHVDQILKHVEWMKTTDQWRKDNGAFIPAPLVYLNGQRWDGAEIPEVTSTVHVRDPYLVKLDEERKNFVPMSDEMRQKIQALIKKG
jgi:hypothetical protein